MAAMHCSNLSVYLNSVTERGPIIPTVSGAWSLFMSCSDSRGHFVERDWKRPRCVSTLGLLFSV